MADTILAPDDVEALRRVVEYPGRCGHDRLSVGVSILRHLLGEVDRLRPLATITAAEVATRFSPERPPTQNEQHLLNLLGWREKEAAEAKAELARLKTLTYCAYCGHEVPLDADGGVIAEHIRTCERHPMRVVEAENARLRAVADAARALLATEYDTDAYAAAWEGLWEALRALEAS